MKPAHVACTLALLASAASASAQPVDVAAELWDRPRSATDVLGSEGIRRTVAAALAQPDTRIVIHHGAAQESLLQAEELRSWLGALAFDTRRIVLRSGLPAGAQLKLEVSP